MKKVLSTAVLCALLTLSFFFAGCKNSVSSGGGNSGGGESGQEYNPPEKQIPLTLEAIEDGEIIFTNLDCITRLKYTINDNDSIEITETSGSKSISVSAGDVVSLYAQGTSNPNILQNYFTIGCSSDCYIYGNVMSLLTDDFQNETTITKNDAFAYLFSGNTHIKNHSEKNLVLPATSLTSSCYLCMFLKCSSLTKAPVLPATTLAQGCYCYMFSECSSLTKAPDLPATLLASSCYGRMFDGCKKLTTAPKLPATTLAEDCYGYMFSGCSSLTKAPDLPATSLVPYCYHDMFSNCSSLTKAPNLPATVLTQSCYEGMFNGCSSLKKIECLATDISATGCTTIWLSFVPSTGTFIKAAGTDWSSKTGASGIPSGWTVQEK